MVIYGSVFTVIFTWFGKIGSNFAKNFDEITPLSKCISNKILIYGRKCNYLRLQLGFYKIWVLWIDFGHLPGVKWNEFPNVQEEVIRKYLWKLELSGRG